MTQRMEPTWNLDSLFPGGSASAEYTQLLDRIENDVHGAARMVETLAQTDVQSEWAGAIVQVQDVERALAEAMAFVECLTAQNVDDEKAGLLLGRVHQLSASLTAVGISLDAQIIRLSDERWNLLLADAQLQGTAFRLQERRDLARQKLDPAREELISDLMVDGYHAWGEMYQQLVGRMKIPFEVDGDARSLSVGQLDNKLYSGNQEVREHAFQAWQKAWAAESELFTRTLNHLAGFRLAAYRHRGWDSPLQEPLQVNRLSADSLHAMWDTIEQNKAIFLDVLKRKAHMLGLSELSWYDVSAPLGTATRTYTLEEARAFIVEQFRRFDPEMADFADACFENRWIEAEDRVGKRPGGFCTSFPIAGESRIFMTYSGTFSNVATLAHELGHAYHHHVLRDLPFWSQGYAMNVAETASTFAEGIVADAALQSATDPSERLALLEDKVSRSITFFMDIHSRFLFEARFYERRKQGLVSTDELSAMMKQAQQDAFHGALGQEHPLFWASKLHFHITDVPFYNFPYTFGYLFSTGIYAHAKQEGSGFARKYVALLRDTARMTTEKLARTHLGVDLTKPDFWQAAIDVAVADARAFLEATKDL